MKVRSLAIWLGILPIALGASFFAACGGDDDDGGSSGGGGGTGSDAAFVADICKAGAKFSKDLESASSNISSTDPKEIAAKFAKPFEDFSNAFSRAKPPKDLAAWHKDASAKLKDAVAQLKKGDAESGFFAGDEPFPDPPKDASDRLSKIAEKNKDCQDSDFNFGQ
jgi:hypothetical protein